MLIRTTLATYPTILRAPDGGASGATPPADPPAGNEGGAGDATPPADDSLFGLADDDAPPPTADGKPQRPAWLGEKFWDAEKGAPKVEDLARANGELRSLIAKGAQKAPATADAYTVPPVEGVADPLAALGGKDDPLWASVRQAAHGAGVSQVQMAAILGPVLAAAAARAAGTEPAPVDPEAAAAERQETQRAELAKLGPNGRAVVQQTGAWVKGLEARGVFTPEEALALRQISTAEGVRALAKLRSMTGEAPIPVEALAADGGMTRADAERLMEEGFAKKDSAMVEKARAILTKMEKAGQLG